jgi:hypothetical protein
VRATTIGALHGCIRAAFRASRIFAVARDLQRVNRTAEKTRAFDRPISRCAATTALPWCANSRASAPGGSHDEARQQVPLRPASDLTRIGHVNSVELREIARPILFSEEGWGATGAEGPKPRAARGHPPRATRWDRNRRGAYGPNCREQRLVECPDRGILAIRKPSLRGAHGSRPTGPAEGRPEDRLRRARGQAPRRSNPEDGLDCFAEPVLGPAFGRTRGLAMTKILGRDLQNFGIRTLALAVSGLAARARVRADRPSPQARTPLRSSRRPPQASASRRVRATPWPDSSAPSRPCHAARARADRMSSWW